MDREFTVQLSPLGVRLGWSGGSAVGTGFCVRCDESGTGMGTGRDWRVMVGAPASRQMGKHTEGGIPAQEVYSDSLLMATPTACNNGAKRGESGATAAGLRAQRTSPAI